MGKREKYALKSFLQSNILIIDGMMFYSSVAYNVKYRTELS